MRKTNSNIKRVKFFKRIAIVQLVIIAIFLFLFCMSRPVDIDDCAQETITVEDKQYINRVRAPSYFVLYCKGEKYRVTTYPDGFSSRSTYETIEIGDKLEILSEKRFTLLGYINLIVDAKGEGEFNLDISSFNEGRKTTNLIIVICFIVAEAIFFVISFLAYKLIPRKKRKEKE